MPVGLRLATLQAGVGLTQMVGDGLKQLKILVPHRADGNESLIMSDPSCIMVALGFQVSQLLDIQLTETEYHW
jgi:hypothetical protein